MTDPKGNRRFPEYLLGSPLTYPVTAFVPHPSAPVEYGELFPLVRPTVRFVNDYRMRTAGDPVVPGDVVPGADGGPRVVYQRLIAGGVRVLLTCPPELAPLTREEYMANERAEFNSEYGWPEFTSVPNQDFHEGRS